MKLEEFYKNNTLMSKKDMEEKRIKLKEIFEEYIVDVIGKFFNQYNSYVSANLTLENRDIEKTFKQKIEINVLKSINKRDLYIQVEKELKKLTEKTDSLKSIKLIENYSKKSIFQNNNRENSISFELEYVISF